MDGAVAHPLIAIVGSIDPGRPYDPPLRDVAEARQACVDLGRELAVQGCDLVVYSGAAGFAEGYVVRGYVESGAAGPKSIHVRSPMGATSAEFPEAVARRDLFDMRIDPSSDWEVSYYRSLIETQGLVLIGGGRSTLVTGLLRLTFGIPMVPVATFGGNAAKAWAALERVSDDAGRPAVGDGRALARRVGPRCWSASCWSGAGGSRRPRPGPGGRRSGSPAAPRSGCSWPGCCWSWRWRRCRWRSPGPRPPRATSPCSRWRRCSRPRPAR
jgi:hypothetical protein